MRYIFLSLMIFSLLITPVFASSIEPGEVPGNTEETYPADLPVTFAIPDFSIVVQPTSRTVLVNNSATFTVLAIGENLEYAWQYSTNGGASWYRSSSSTQGYNTPTLTVVGTAARNGFMYRCIISNDSGTIVSDPVTLSVVTSGSDVPHFYASDVLLLFSLSVAAAGDWFMTLLSATGMTNFYLTIIIIFLVISILMTPVLGAALGGLSDSVRKPKNNSHKEDK